MSDMIVRSIEKRTTGSISGSQSPEARSHALGALSTASPPENSKPRKRSKKDNSRIHLTPQQRQELFAEAAGKCPLCGAPLMIKKNGRLIRVYDEAHIYPHNPTPTQLAALKDVPVPTDVENVKNIIFLCKKCHKLQDDWTTAEDYLRLYSVKQLKAAMYRATQETATIDIEPELKSILNNLSNLDDSKLIDLSLRTLAVKKKIEEGELQRKVIGYVTMYYQTLMRMFQELDNRRTSAFSIIATQFHQAFLKQEREQPLLFPDKGQIFDGLVEWVMTKTGSSRAACEAVVSYFVQDCEVFHAISK